MSALSASNIDAVAYHLEQGLDNGSISREALALQLRSVSQEMTRDISELSSLRATVTAQAKRIAALEQAVNEARELIMLVAFGSFAPDAIRPDYRVWIYANPAQVSEQDMIDSWHERL